MKDYKNQILCGDALSILKDLPANIVQTCITSPPYFRLRDYGVEEQLGLEQTPQEYVKRLVNIFREVHRVLKDDGTLWLVLRDSECSPPEGNTKNSLRKKSGLSGINSERYLQTLKSSQSTKKDTSKIEGLKPKDLIGVPWRIAFALQQDGWYLRQDIIWHKPNPMPESVKDRCTKSHEYIFLFSKSPKYYFDHKIIREPAIIPPEARGSGQVFRKPGGKASINYGDSPDTWVPDGKRNKRSGWTVPIQPYKDAHFATFPIDLITPCI